MEREKEGAAYFKLKLCAQFRTAESFYKNTCPEPRHQQFQLMLHTNPPYPLIIQRLNSICRNSPSNMLYSPDKALDSTSSK